MSSARRKVLVLRALIAAAQQRSRDARQRAATTIFRLDRAGLPLTMTNVAQAVGSESQHLRIGSFVVSVADRILHVEGTETNRRNDAVVMPSKGEI